MTDTPSQHMKLLGKTSFFILCCIFSATTVFAQSSVTLLSGESLSGKIESISDGELRIGDQDAVPFAKLERINFDHIKTKLNRRDRLFVRLLDGSMIVTSSYSATQELGTFSVSPESELSVETRNIDHVRFNLSPELDAPWKSAFKEKITGDAVFALRNGELNALDGIIKSVGEETVAFKFDEDLIDVKRSRLAGIAYFHVSGRKFPSALCQCTDVFGGTYMVKSLQMAGKDRLQLALLCGDKISLALSEISELDFMAGKVLYLDKVEPLASEWSPLVESGSLLDSLGKLMSYRTNESLSGEALQLFSEDGFSSSKQSFAQQQKLYSRGLGIRSGTKLVYEVPLEFTRLSAICGIDPARRPLGHVVLRISGDGRELVTKTISGKDKAPTVIDVDISGVSKLLLHVDFGDQSDIADHLNICNLRLVK